jgi:hypothetical protein
MENFFRGKFGFLGFVYHFYIKIFSVHK